MGRWWETSSERESAKAEDANKNTHRINHRSQQRMSWREVRQKKRRRLLYRRAGAAPQRQQNQNQSRAPHRQAQRGSQSTRGRGKARRAMETGRLQALWRLHPTIQTAGAGSPRETWPEAPGGAGGDVHTRIPRETSCIPSSLPASTSSTQSRRGGKLAPPR